MIVWILLVAALVAIVGFGVALTIRSKQDFAAANEVVPGIRSAAPASWAGAHTTEARLHRRLGAAVTALRADPRIVESGLAEPAQRLEAEAVAIDERLVVAAALPARHREAAIAEFTPLVDGFEDAVATLVKSTSVSDSKELLAQTVAEADIRLEALARARAEVEAVDSSARVALPTTDLSTELSTNPSTDPPSDPPSAQG